MSPSYAAASVAHMGSVIDTGGWWVPYVPGSARGAAGRRGAECTARRFGKEKRGRVAAAFAPPLVAAEYRGEEGTPESGG